MLLVALLTRLHRFLPLLPSDANVLELGVSEVEQLADHLNNIY